MLELNCNRLHCTICAVLSTVDGGWSDWTQWGSCSASCDGGTHEKSRGCNNPSPENGGKNGDSDNSDGGEWRTEYGHFTSRRPFPQQAHITRPSGDAPRYRYLGLTCNPVASTSNSACVVLIISTYTINREIFAGKKISSITFKDKN